MALLGDRPPESGLCVSVALGLVDIVVLKDERRSIRLDLRGGWDKGTTDLRSPWRALDATFWSRYSVLSIAHIFDAAVG
jgi:hypothetical protein